MKETIISSLVTISGFIISFLGIKRELNNTLHVQQNEFMLRKMDDIIEQIDNTISYTSAGLDGNKKITSNQLNEKLKLIYKKIIPYGSNKAISILEKINSTAYFWETKKTKYKDYNLYFIFNMYLLMCQIKMDMTGIIVNPETLFKMKFPDYDKCKDEALNAINDTVKELKLCKKFLIK